MAKGIFDQVIDGEPYYVSTPTHYEQCCDCGLTHKVQYRVEDKDGNRIKGAMLRLTVWRNPKYTARRRQQLKKQGKLK